VRGRLPRIYREKAQRVVAVGGAREPVVHQVRVDAEGDARVGMAGHAGELEHVRALGDQLRNGEVSEVVEVEGSDLRPLQRRVDQWLPKPRAQVRFLPGHSSTGVRRPALVLPAVPRGLTRETQSDHCRGIGHLAEDPDVDVRHRVAGLVVARVERPAGDAAKAADQPCRLPLVCAREEPAHR
jgi:hypothetical protein